MGRRGLSTRGKLLLLQKKAGVGKRTRIPERPKKKCNVVYEDYFVPWFQKIYPEHSRNGDRPCLGWFMSARHDPDFKDVKNRAKHHHARCEDCANLQAQRLRAFLNEADREKYEREWQDHQNEKRLWREFEQDLVVQRKHNPADNHMLWLVDQATHEEPPHCAFPAHPFSHRGPGPWQGLLRLHGKGQVPEGSQPPMLNPAGHNPCDEEDHG